MIFQFTKRNWKNRAVIINVSVGMAPGQCSVYDVSIERLKEVLLFNTKHALRLLDRFKALDGAGNFMWLSEQYEIVNVFIVLNVCHKVGRVFYVLSLSILLILYAQYKIVSGRYTQSLRMKYWRMYLETTMPFCTMPL